MAGIFSKSARPLLPGSYFNWDATAAAQAPPSVGSIVAIPFTSDWGPFKRATLVGSFGEYLAIYGATVGTPGYNAVWQAFQGEGGFDGRYGAGAVLCYRQGSSSAAKASKALQNTTPAAAMTLTAKYEGTFGNGLRVTTQDHAADATKNELLLLNGTQLLETYVYTDTDIAGLVAQINAVSGWVTATLTTDGVALTAVSASAFTGGNDGSVLIAGDWTATMTALESERFGVFAPYGLTDSSVLASLGAWAAGPPVSNNGRNAKGQRFELVVGGASGETAADAITRSLVFNDGNVMNVGQSSFKTNDLLDANGIPVTFTPSQFAPRIAGVLSNRGEAMGMTNARFPNVELVNGPSAADVEASFLGGVLSFARDSDAEAPVHLVKGITTFTRGAPGTTNADSHYPYLIFRNPKFMRTMQNVEVEWTDWANRNVVGVMPVNNKTRDEAMSEITTRLKARASVGIIQSGNGGTPAFSVAVDDNPPPSDSDEFIALKIGLRFGRSVEQVFFTVKAG